MSEWVAISARSRAWQAEGLCCSCGDISTSWASAQRHADKFGHTRIELLLERAGSDE